ncbi:MAG: DNA polymerase III subunit delta', partial [Planctomycetota bacterium]
MTDETQRADQIEGAPHPRETRQIFGHDAAEATVLQAFADKRLHHAWLLTGPAGIGKATLAWSMARFLIATPDPGNTGLFGPTSLPDNLGIEPDHPVARRVLAGSEPNLASVRRGPNEKTGRLRDEIVVDDIRALHRFFGLSAPDGGRRVVIVDAADEMNVSAANALLKMLEEPPDRTTLLLVSHQPSRLLPTIRSRCRTLRLAPLGPEDMRAALDEAGAASLSEIEAAHLAVLSSGSVGMALRLLALDGLETYGELMGLLGTLPRLDRPRARALADKVAARGAGERLDLLLLLTDIALSRLARTGATGALPGPEATRGEAEILVRLAET